MEAPFIMTIEDLLSYAEANASSLVTYGGDCKHCPRCKDCVVKSRDSYIEALLHMNGDATRFPGLLRVAQRHKSALYLVPSEVYKRVYGLFSPFLPCPFDSKRILGNLDSIRKVYELLTDENSKTTFLNVLMYRLTTEADYVFRALSMQPEFFIRPFSGLGAEEVFVDCGAYNGDTFVGYCKYNHTPRAAYLFEPDLQNLNALNYTVSEYKDVQLHVIDKGVSDKPGVQYFAQGQKTSSRCLEKEEKGSVKLVMTSIDDSVEEDVTFIKLDVEGAEKNALLGAREHILRTYPNLAVCVYHYVPDLWEIPLSIHEWFPEYDRFELHHHTTTFAETVLYVYRQ